MGTSSIDSVYLTGWEYNRLLQEDPVTPRNSALPAELLWNGAAHFWLFKTVYCTKEAFDNEFAAAKSLHWATGRIYAELANRGWLVPVDWRGLSVSTHDLLRDAHRSCRSSISDAQIRSYIREGSDFELESIKLRLLRPIGDSLHCLLDVSPSGLKTWQPQARRDSTSPRLTERAIRALTAPLARFASVSSRICRPPGSGVSEEAIERQRSTQKNIERPMIPYLQAGEQDPDHGLDFRGERGYEAYLEALKPHAAAYMPINRRLWSDWKAHDHTLRELRRLAESYLWPRLHGEWLPKLIEQREKFVPEFQRLIDNAVKNSPMASLMNLSMNLVTGVGTLTGLGVAAYIIAQNDLTGVAASLTTGIAGVSGAIVAASAKQLVEAEGHVPIFYNRAISLVRKR